MARFRKIDPRIWNDAKFRALSDRGKLCFLFLLTHPHMTMLGAMRATIPGLASELGWESKAFGEAFGEVLSKGLAEGDPKALCVVLPNFIRYNKPQSPNVAKSMAKAVDLIPECELKTQHLQRVKAFVEGMGKAFREAFATPSRNKKLEDGRRKMEEGNKKESKKEGGAEGKVNEVGLSLLSRWNSVEGVKRCLGLTPKLKTSIRARLKEKIQTGEEERVPWLRLADEALGKMPSLPGGFFGKNNRGWKPDFAWFVRSAEPACKIVSGFYDGWHPNTAEPQRQDRNAIDWGDTAATETKRQAEETF